MDPISGVTAGVGAASVVTDMYAKIKKARAEGKIAKAEALMKELEAREAAIKAYADSDRALLRIIREGKCEGVGKKIKDFEKQMDGVFTRYPEQRAILGKKYERCLAIAKRSKH